MNRLKEVLIVLLALAAVLVPFSLLIGWNLFTLLLFWFLLVPTISFYAPKLVNKRNSQLTSSLLGLLLFYGGMVFMIYEHSQSDFFQVLIWSALINLALTALLQFVVNQERLRAKSA